MNVVRFAPNWNVGIADFVSLLRRSGSSYEGRVVTTAMTAEPEYENTGKMG